MHTNKEDPAREIVTFSRWQTFKDYGVTFFN